MGYRQISQMSMYDYIIGITIGSIASEMIVVDNFHNIIKPLTGMVIYALFPIIIYKLSQHSLKLRKFIKGKPVVLYQNNQINNHILSISKIDINEFLMQLRLLGYFDLTQIDIVILEPNGAFSVYPKEQYKPTVVGDFSNKTQNEKPPISLIVDGHIIYSHLKKSNKDIHWLEKQLKSKGITNIQDLLLVLFDNNKTITIYKKDGN